MKKVQINLFLNLLAYLILLFMIATGLLMEYILLPGSRGGRGLLVFGMNRHQWGDIHFYFSIAFIVAMALHLYLHWSWVLSTFRRFITAKRLTGLIALLVVSILIVASPFLVPLTRGADEHGDEHATPNQTEQPYDEGAFSLRGYMTFAEVAAASSVSVEEIIALLALTDSPEKIRGERVGPYLRSQGLEMDNLRLLLEAKNASQ